ncbi:MAG TPA: EDR1-related protein [Candidatus Saccharimonadales bacterium]|nr:EDR1-related protein [Candidatus Saccharimonadales bacterium]
MARQIGTTTVRYTLDAVGEPHPTESPVTTAEFNQLIGNFATDPVGSLTWARDALFAISAEQHVPEADRSQRLSHYLDAYFDLTIKLDQAAFPADAPGTHHEGIPSYMPDGFVDMGRDPAHDPAKREGEQLWVDKHEILTKYKPLLTRIFEHDYSDMTPAERALSMGYSIAREVYQSIPLPKIVDDKGSIGLGGDKVKLSEITEALCRHRALLFQVLSQAVGLNTRVIKGPRMGRKVENHAANFLQAGDKWYLFDVSNPYATDGPDGEQTLLPAAYELEDGPLAPGEARRLSFTRATLLVGDVSRVRYIARDDMYWYVEHHTRQATNTNQ